VTERPTPPDPEFERFAADEALYRSLIEDQSEFVVRWTPDGTLTFVNAAYCRCLGKPLGELLGRSLFGAQEGAERLAVLGRLADPERGRAERPELQLSRGPVGEGRWHEWTDRARYDEAGRIVEILSVGRDVHEKVLQRQALEESELRYRSLFDDSRDAIIISGPDGAIEDVNQAALELFEATAKDQLVGIDPNRLYEDFSQRERLIHEVTEKGFARDFELRLITRRGNKRTVLDTVTAARDGDGRLLGYRGMLRDVTAERRLAEQFRQSQEMDAIGRLAGGVAHDFNNLLTVICGYSDIGLVEAAANDPLRQHFAQIQGAARRATDLTRQLLAFSRQQDLELQRLDLNRVIADFEDLLRRSISEDILLETVFEEPLWSVTADPGQLERVLMNLVLNARDAMPAGGRLVIETRNVPVHDRQPDDRVAGLAPGDYVALLVSDTGCGMDEATRGQIFEPFFTTKGRDKGTGLGLSTVYGIVKQSGGSILAYSESGEGSVFKIYLPRADGKAPQDEPATAAPAVALPPATVLVVDDDEAICKLAHRILAPRGLRVLTAGSAEEALAVSDSQDGVIDLLLTDLVLPGMDGLELAVAIQRRRPAIKLVVMSGYSERGRGLEERLPEGGQFLGKPFSPADLAQRIASAL
jgi:two-component system, cell cycle sensor histidine kinase and response regulator CckA